MALEHLDNYYMYQELALTGRTSVNVNSITKDSWKQHFEGICNILSDGIETEHVQSMMIKVLFADGEDIELSIFDYFNQIVMWYVMVATNSPIYSEYLFWGIPVDIDKASTELYWSQEITQNTIKNYIDTFFLDVHRKDFDNVFQNNLIDDTLFSFLFIDNFALYLMNTLNHRDTIDLMKQNDRFRELLHLDLSSYPVEEIKTRGLNATREAIDIIKKSEHCLSYSFKAKEATSEKQFKEVYIHVGNRGDGQGSLFGATINNSFINGGLSNPASQIMESSTGRIAQIIAKTNVGSSGSFARILGLNNIDSIINPEVGCDCHTRHFIKITILNDKMLKAYNNRYYRFTPNGMEYRLKYKEDKSLIGKTLFFRSPITCISHSKGNGICYRCYGDLAFTNIDINPGKMAAEIMSSRYTQKMLSAKHLLEEQIRAMKWDPIFYSLFDVQFNLITLLEDEKYNGYKLVINNIELEDEYDDFDYNEYILSFDVITPSNKVITISTEEKDNIYLSMELKEKLNTIKPDENDNYILDMSKLTDLGALFLIKISNNEISAALDNVKSIINKKAITESMNKDQITQTFVEAVLDSGMNISAIHLEVILSNQIRDKDDILEMPNWEYLSESYQVLTLNHALSNSPSVTKRLSYQNIARAFFSPGTFKANKASCIDLLFMKKPQLYIDDDIIDTSGTYISDKDDPVKVVTIDKSLIKKEEE